MTKRTTKPEPTAAETYAARRNDIARLMDVLQMELDKHAEGAKADPRNWGFAGSLGKDRRGQAAATNSMVHEVMSEIERIAGC